MNQPGSDKKSKAAIVNAGDGETVLHSHSADHRVTSGPASIRKLPAASVVEGRKKRRWYQTTRCDHC